MYLFFIQSFKKSRFKKLVFLGILKIIFVFTDFVFIFAETKKSFHTKYGVGE